MRSEHFERIRRRLAAEHRDLEAAGLKSDFEPARPWDLVFKEAAKDSEFWGGTRLTRRR